MAAILSKSLFTFLDAKGGKNSLGGRSDVDHILQRVVKVDATEACVVIGARPHGRMAQLMRRALTRAEDASRVPLSSSAISRNGVSCRRLGNFELLKLICQCSMAVLPLLQMHNIPTCSRLHALSCFPNFRKVCHLGRKRSGGA